MVKYFIVCIIASMSLIELYGQNFFKEEFNEQERSKLSFQCFNKENSTHKYFKLKFKEDNSELGNIAYPLVIKSEENIDTIRLIEDLLSFEGDTSICVIPIRCYDPKLSQVYMGNLKDYSIQTEALFLINQLYFDKPFHYSPYPILKNIESSKEESIDGEIIKLAYTAYKQWFVNVKKVGLKEAKKQDIDPLGGYPIKWYK
jgi:hypothetical protein